MNLQALYGQAVGFHQRGNLAQAEILYLQILSADPSGFAPNYMLGIIRAQQGRNGEALDLIGVALKAQPDATVALMNQGNILCALGRFADAVRSYDRALATKPDHAEAYYKRGLALGDLNRPAQALASYDKALAIKPDHAEALSDRGNVLRALNRLEEALASYDRSVTVKPDFVEALLNRGVTLCDLKRFEKALMSYDKALAIRPDDAEAWYNRGHALQDLKRFEEAVASYDKALAIRPDNVPAWCNRGVALAELNRAAEALANYDKALAIQPHYAEALYNRGLALFDLKRPEQALADYDMALAIKPDFIEAMGNRGIALQYLKRFDEALASFDRAIAIDPGHAKSHADKGFCKLLLGQFEDGWQLHEWRKKLPDSGPYPAYAQPVWSGAEDLNGKTLVIHAEQALGDTIQFCRYAALAEARGAHVILCVQNALVRLVQTLSPTIVVRALDAAPSDFDYHCALLSMPLAFKTGQDNFPATVPYLRAEPQRVQSWGGKIGSDGFKIGISWQGSHAGRSFLLRYFEGLSKIPGVRLISLQKKAGVEQLLDMPPGMKVEALGDGFDEGADAFIDTAAVMENLDLIITADTSVGHLAGALGRPVWVALQCLPDWRWLLDRSDSPWYPATRLFRQPANGDWAGAFAQMEAPLAELAKAK